MSSKRLISNLNKREILALKGFTAADSKLSVKQLRSKLNDIKKTLKSLPKRGITVDDFNKAYNVKHSGSKLLSKLTKAEILSLNGMEEYNKLTVKALKNKLSERVKALKLKKGATIDDFNNARPSVPKAPDSVPILPRYIDSDEYKARQNKKADDELFNKKLPSLRQKNISDYTDYSKYKDVKYYQKWFSTYLKHIKRGESVEIDLSSDRTQIEAFENVVKYLKSNPLHNQTVEFGGVDIDGNKRSYTLNSKTRGKLEFMIDMVSGRVDYEGSDGPANYVREEIGKYFSPVKLSIHIRNYTDVPITTVNKKGKNVTKNGKRVNIKTARYNSDDVLTSWNNYENTFTSNERNGGRFWKYINRSGIDLAKYQIFNDYNIDNYKDNCFIYACKQSTLFDEHDIEALIGFIKVNRVPVTTVREISETFKIPILVRKIYIDGKINRDDVKIVLDTTKDFPNKKPLKLLLYDDHYMIDESVMASIFYINNKQRIDELFPNMPLEKRQTITKLHKDNRVDKRIKEPTSLHNVLNAIFKNNLFEPIRSMEEINDLGVAIDENLNDYTDLDYKPDICTRLIDSAVIAEKMKEREFTGGIFYSDFETDPTTNPHTPYLNVTIGGPDNVTWYFIGDNIGLKLIHNLPDKSLVYFHNLKYDVSFFINSSENFTVDLIQRNGKTIQLVLRHKQLNKTITFRDSFSLIPSKLASFKDLFGLETQKEVMAYKLYTAENRKRRIIPIEEYYHQLDVENSYKTPAERQQMKDQLLKNAINVPDCYNEADQTINIMKYAAFYCERDCQVLKQGMERFDNDLRQVFDGYECKYPGIHNYLSISAIGYSLAKLYGCFDGCYELTGKPQNFIQRCVNGGRTMTAANKKLIVLARKIQDFDAVSLYPSAMSIMNGIAKGIPKVLIDCSNLDKLMGYDDFHIEIDIHSIKPKSEYGYDFGLIWKINEHGSKVYCNEAVSSYHVDKRTLMDLLDNYYMDYTIKRGYYWDEGFNNKINTFITRLFDLRATYKKAGNPLEKTIKLLLNSIYGKSILKPIDHEVKSIPNYQLDKFLYRNYNYITSIESNDSRSYVRMIKPINRHFNLPQFGVAVLSWSKHLMNCVMCTAEQLGMKIYYQDTDSMHIDENSLEALETIYRYKYGCELIGTKLTQFHSDFDAIADGNQIKEACVNDPSFKYNIWSEKLIALGKKSYLDILKDNLGNSGYHIRLKGIPNQCILNYCTNHNLTVEELYMKLYDGEEITFDLLDGTPGFQKTNTFEQITRDCFKRRVKF